CFYWASNHPDFVYGETYAGERTLPSGIAADPERANVRLDWLRAKRSRHLAAGTSNTIGRNRPFQIDHLQINSAWQSLNVVIENAEIGDKYTPAARRSAEPYGSAEEMAKHLREELAPLELTLATEYLYAMLSIVSVEEAQTLARETGRWLTLADDVAAARQRLMLIAINEMQHLRWANQLLWELLKAERVREFAPVLERAKIVPLVDLPPRVDSLRPLTPDILTEFIQVERPRGLIDGSYGRVIATLRQPGAGYPPHMAELAERIANDGMLHETQFLRIRTALK